MKSPLLRTGIVVAVLMMAASVFAVVLRPTQKIADASPKIDLENMIPQHFGEWQEEKLLSTHIVNPQTKEMLDKLYNQTLSRTYRNEQGYRVMLSVAYGGDQRDAMQVHKPEICYPAQGFVLDGKTTAMLSLANTVIPVTRVATHAGQRREPITYWTTIGDRTVQGGIHKKLVEMSYGLTGKIPDGMLVRVSSIDTDTPHGYAIHDRFIDQMVSAVSPDARQRLIGVAP
jgi:EpsI family protein